MRMLMIQISYAEDDVNRLRAQSTLDTVRQLVSNMDPSDNRRKEEERKTEKTWAEIILKYGTFDGPIQYYDELQNQLPSPPPTIVESLRHLAQLAEYLAKRGNFKSAKDYQKVVLSALENERKKDILSISQARHALAEIHWGLKEYNVARKLHEENVVVLTDQLGPSDPLTLAAKECLADTYSDMGMRLESVQYLIEVANARLEQLGPEKGWTILIRQELVGMWFRIVMKSRKIGWFWYLHR